MKYMSMVLVNRTAVSLLSFSFIKEGSSMAIEAKARVTVPAKSQLIDSVKKALFIIGSAVFVFIAARNTITWHAQRFWGASGDFWQRQFDNAYELFGGSDFAVAVFGKLPEGTCSLITI